MFLKPESVNWRSPETLVLLVAACFLRWENYLQYCHANRAGELWSFVFQFLKLHVGEQLAGQRAEFSSILCRLRCMRMSLSSWQASEHSTLEEGNHHKGNPKVKGDGDHIQPLGNTQEGLYSLLHCLVLFRFLIWRCCPRHFHEVYLKFGTIHVSFLLCSQMWELQLYFWWTRWWIYVRAVNMHLMHHMKSCWKKHCLHNESDSIFELVLRHFYFGLHMWA